MNHADLSTVSADVVTSINHNSKSSTLLQENVWPAPLLNLNVHTLITRGFMSTDIISYALVGKL